MREELQLVRGVEGGELGEALAPGAQSAQAMQREDALQPVVAHDGVGELPLLHDRQLGPRRSQRLREHPPPAARRPAAARAPHRHALEAAARRARLQHVSAQPEARERAHAPLREGAHARRPVDAARHGDEPGCAAALRDQPDRLARHPHPELELWADRHPLDEATQALDQKGVALVAAVPAHRVAQQAARDPDPDRRPLPGARAQGGLHGARRLAAGRRAPCATARAHARR